MDSLREELKVEPQYTQAIPVGEGIMDLPMKLHWCMPIGGSQF